MKKPEWVASPPLTARATMAALLDLGAQIERPNESPSERRESRAGGRCGWISSFDGLPAPIWFALACILCILLFLSPHSRGQVTAGGFRQLVEAYRAGEHSSATQELITLEREEIPKRSIELVAGLDLERPADRKRLLAAVLLLTESAVVTTLPEASDFYMEQAVKLTTSLEEGEGTALQKELHLAACYRLFHERRVSHALRLIEPAARRYPSDSALQLAFASIAELVGWLDSSAELLDRARAAYEAILILEPGNVKARLRLGRVLSLLRRPDEAIPHLRAAMGTLDSEPERVVALLSLGEALRDAGFALEALDHYRRALDLDPGSQAATVALAYAQRELGNPDEAAAALAPSLGPGFDAAGPDSFHVYLMADAGSQGERWRALRARLP